MRRTKRQNRTTMVLLAIIAVISAIVYIVRDMPKTIEVSNGDISDAEVSVHIIDVGQGDAAFIDNGDKDILIDAGTGDASQQLIRYLDSMGVKNIEYAFFSHPHEDHIGGGDDVLARYDIENVVMPEYSEDTACYSALMNAIDFENCDLVYTSAGDKFVIGDITVEIFSPEADTTPDDANLVSLMMKVSYGEIDTLFTGDAEVENEEYVLEHYYDKLRCEILKVGHHGSSTSSSEAFIEAVSPGLALISVGADNSYGHPHVETLVTLNSYLDEIHRTDHDGNIVVGMAKDKYWIAGD